MKNDEPNKTLLKLIKQLDYENIDDDEFNNLAGQMFSAHSTNKIVYVISRTEVNEDALGDTEAELDEYFFIFYVKEREDYNDELLLEELRGKIQGLNFSENCKIDIIEIFDSKKQSVKNNQQDRVRNLRRMCRDIIDPSKEKKIKLRNIQYLSYSIPTEFKEQKMIKIKIKDRIRSLEQSCQFGEFHLTGYVFSAELDSLIELYDQLGDNLFAKNVRVGGVQDSVGVEGDIRRTYKSAPNEFWFLNNGISLLVVTKSELDLNIYDQVQIPIKDLDDISIINGAQTISAVSEEKYSNGESSEKPTVLLRIYHYCIPQNETNDINLQKNKKDLEKFSEKVTISLNKQKPIKKSDLAYLTEFATNIQSIKLNFPSSDQPEKSKFAFDFVRNGELESFNLSQYYIGKFAKVVKAFLAKKPGKARTMAYNSLLETTTIDSLIRLVDTEVFVDDLQKSIDEIDRNIIDKFIENYAPVNFAMKLWSYLDEEKNFEKIVEEYIQEKFPEKEERADEGGKISSELESFSKYGVLVMISSVVHLINNFKENYSNWQFIGIGDEDTEDEISIETLRKNIVKILEVFIEVCNECPDMDFKDSNEWKKDDIFDKIKIKLKNREEAK